MKNEKGASRGVAFVLALVSCVTLAAVKPDENILLNGKLEAEQATLPSYWKGSDEVFKWHADGGPGGLPYISVAAHGLDSQQTRLQQVGLNLVSNGLYRVSMRVRTKDFTCADHTGLLIINAVMWGETAGLYTLAGGFRFPRDTAGEWKLVSRDFHLFGSSEGYKAMLHVTGQEGELDVADLKLEALDDLALSKTRPSEILAIQLCPRLVPCRHLLAKIPDEDPFARFRFYGDLEGDDSDYDVVIRPAGSAYAARVALSRDEMALPLPEGLRHGQVTVSVEKRGATGDAAFSRTYNFGVRPARSAPLRTARRLNNFVSEVLAADIAKDDAQELAFDLSRDSWAFVGVTGERGSDFAVRLDGADVMDAGTPRGETFRKLTAGRHTLAIAGVAKGRVVVRQMAETFNYCPGVNSFVKENPAYDWKYQEKYGLPAVTTENGGSVAPPEIRFRARGYRHLDNLNMMGMAPEKMRAKLNACRGLVAPAYDGVTCDEQALDDLAATEKYTRGFWLYDADERPTRPIYTWAFGKMTDQPVHLDFLASTINISGGEGKLLREIYCRSVETEDEARALIDKYVLGTFREFRAANPDCLPSMGLVFGNFNQVPILSLNHHPEVDYKYYLDLQMNCAANDPAMRDIGLIGYWGSYYADDELHRWSLRLLRHYAVEGHTNMLSAAYGFTYNPNHVLNGDFRGTLLPWRVSGRVRLDSHEGFGRKAQGRWGGNVFTGDTFASLTREEGAPATLKQTLRGLVPGRRYSLQFAAFDAKDAKADKRAPRQFALRATLGDGAEVDPSLSWLFVDRRDKGRYNCNNDVALINLHHVVFTANRAEVELILDNSEAKPGEELGVNFVSVNPYYAE